MSDIGRPAPSSPGAVFLEKSGVQPCTQMRSIKLRHGASQLMLAFSFFDPVHFRSTKAAQFVWLKPPQFLSAGLFYLQNRGKALSGSTLFFPIRSRPSKSSGLSADAPSNFPAQWCAMRSALASFSKLPREKTNRVFQQFDGCLGNHALPFFPIRVKMTFCPQKTQIILRRSRRNSSHGITKEE